MRWNVVLLCCDERAAGGGGGAADRARRGDGQTVKTQRTADSTAARTGRFVLSVRWTIPLDLHVEIRSTLGTADLRYMYRYILC